MSFNELVVLCTSWLSVNTKTSLSCDQDISIIRSMAMYFMDLCSMTWMGIWDLDYRCTENVINFHSIHYVYNWEVTECKNKNGVIKPTNGFQSSLHVWHLVAVKINRFMNPSKLTTPWLLIRVSALISMSVDVKQRFAKRAYQGFT